MRRTKTAVLIALLAAASLLTAAGRTNKTITITAGTPIQLATKPVLVHELLIQMQPGGSGVGYVMDMNGSPSGTVPSHSTSGNLTATLFPASAAAPGGSYTDVCPLASLCIDANLVWVDGANSGDTVTVSYR